MVTALKLIMRRKGGFKTIAFGGPVGKKERGVVEAVVEVRGQKYCDRHGTGKLSNQNAHSQINALNNTVRRTNLRHYPMMRQTAPSMLKPCVVIFALAVTTAARSAVSEEHAVLFMEVPGAGKTTTMVFPAPLSTVTSEEVTKGVDCGNMQVHGTVDLGNANEGTHVCNIAPCGRPECPGPQSCPPLECPEPLCPIIDICEREIVTWSSPRPFRRRQRTVRIELDPECRAQLESCEHRRGHICHAHAKRVMECNEAAHKECLRQQSLYEHCVFIRSEKCTGERESSVREQNAGMNQYETHV